LVTNFEVFPSKNSECVQSPPFFQDEENMSFTAYVARAFYHGFLGGNPAGVVIFVQVQDEECLQSLKPNLKLTRVLDNRLYENRQDFGWFLNQNESRWRRRRRQQMNFDSKGAERGRFS
jgi:exonuclease I